MNLKQRSLFIYAVFMAIAMIVVTSGLALLDRSEIEREVGQLVPEIRRSLIAGDNRAVRDLIRVSIKDPIMSFEVIRFDGIVVDSQVSTRDFGLLVFDYRTSLTLTADENSIGVLVVKYTLDQSLINGLFIWCIFLLISIPVFVQFRSSLLRIDELNTENARQSAIVTTTQMLAHDVRKPFSLFRMTLDRVKSANSPELMHEALREALPEVERSLASVNGLISDVLNVGAEYKLSLKPVRLAFLVEEVVEELHKLYPTRQFRVRSKVDPGLWVEADDTRLPRVFLNLFSNAIEAVESHDVQLWVCAEPDARNVGHVQVRAGNSGSYIAAEDRARLFEVFYTSGKKGGTGLGLAIVRKILRGHGSEVSCLSEKSEAHPRGMVEFVWSLRRALCVDEASATRSGVDMNVQPLCRLGDVDAQAPRGGVISEAPASLPQVAFIDDSALVRWAWETKLKGKVQLFPYAGPRDFWSAFDVGEIELQKVHTIITDHYFAPDEQYTGLEFAALLRKCGFNGRILLASNGEFQPEKLRGIVDKIVDKQPVDWEELRA